MGESKRSIDTAADAVRDTADRVANRASESIDSARNAVRGTVDRVSDRASSAIDWASDKYDDMVDTPQRVAGAGAVMIRDNPFMAVGLALAAGYLIGRMAR